MTLEVKTVLVTGGTGFIGKALCETLAKEGLHVYVLTRKKKVSGSGNLKKVFYIQELEDLHCVEINIIINLAGETIAKRWTRKSKDKIFSSRIETTRRIIDYIVSSQIKPALLISGSAVGYYGTDSHSVFDEDIKPSATEAGFSHNLCKSWEEEARKAEKFGVRVVLLRIGPVLEQGGGLLSKLLPSFYLGLGSIIGDGTQWISWIDRDDLITLILFIINNPNICGPINATAPNPIRNKEFSLSLAKRLKRLCMIRAPRCMLKLIFGEMADEIMLKGQKVLPKRALHCGFEFKYPTLEQSLEKILHQAIISIRRIGKSPFLLFSIAQGMKILIFKAKTI